MYMCYLLGFANLISDNVHVLPAGVQVVSRLRHGGRPSEWTHESGRRQTGQSREEAETQSPTVHVNAEQPTPRRSAECKYTDRQTDRQTDSLTDRQTESGRSPQC